ncbi:uncharacterized protein I303_100461 [Kwoniella dejecticola CBS 10117]|uniref:Amino acid transporter transmembrane domain-containing protein n=1 Tax=Kwoniella dejecticola CBS 10117 TaxID=1296121 RepID=A0A1A6AF18_9TREE|nr:uncharacterized protein I303_00461 [Kwoniella dejecticola CBS 10117]OBR88644.1 hypothetical protein I303_00461 [Kwoniella dejecticola CBS 10117]
MFYSKSKSDGEKPKDKFIEDIKVKEKKVRSDSNSSSNSDVEVGAAADAVKNAVRAVDSFDDDSRHDAVFGDVGDDGPNYRNVGWIATIAIMLKTMIGLGVLSIPAAFDTLGLIPGVLVLFSLAGMTTWTGYVVGKFKMNHRDCYGIDDAGMIVFGRVGKEILAVAYVLFQTFCAGSGMLSISIAFNALSVHGACTAVFVAVAAVIAFCVASVRTLHKLSPLAWIGLVSIITALLTLTVAVGVQERPAAAPRTPEPFKSDFKLFGNPSFVEAISAVSAIFFAYTGTPSFFPIAAEMKNPKHYTRSLLFTQGGVTVIYTVVGVVVYVFTGSFVSSPALGSAGPLMKKVCYGLALPGIIMSTTICTHFPSKYIFVRVLRGSKHLASNSPTHWITWLGCVGGCATFAYIISSSIPIFSTLVSLIGAFLGPILCLIPIGAMWFYDHYRWADRKVNNPNTIKFKLLAGWNIAIIIIGFFILIAGTYGSVVNIMDSFKNGETTGVWSCADNSGSV